MLTFFYDVMLAVRHAIEVCAPQSGKKQPSDIDLHARLSIRAYVLT